MTEPMIPPAAADAAPLGKEPLGKATTFGPEPFAATPFGPDPFRKAPVAENPVADPFVPAPPPAGYGVDLRDDGGCRTSRRGGDKVARRGSGGAQLIVGVAAGGVAVWSLAGAPEWTGAALTWLAAAGAIVAALVFLLVAVRR